MRKRVWIGLFGLTVEHGNKVLYGCEYAYVNALATADSSHEFVLSVEKACHRLKFNVAEMEDVEPFLCRISNYEVDEGIHKLAEAAELENGTVIFDTFHGSEGVDAGSLN